MDYIESLETNGYAIIPDILCDNDIDYLTTLFKDWYNSIDNIDYLHNKINPHYIFKYHQVGHQRFAWYIRTHPNVRKVFERIWNTTELVVSYDGACYMNPKNLTPNPNSVWTHTDQCPKNKDFICVQGFVSLTDNKHNTLLVYEKSHKLFEQYYKNKNLQNSTKDWNLIDTKFLNSIKDSKIILNVPKGSMVIWDSRLFHQNVCTSYEERIIQYVSMLPKDNILNTISTQHKRIKYFKELRTTNHWCYPIKVNSLQPNTYGDNELFIDYSELTPPDLTDLLDDINKLI